MLIIEVFSETCFDVLAIVQQSLNDNICVPEDGDVIATACLKRLRTNLKKAAQNALFRDLFRLHDLTNWLGLIDDLLNELDSVEEFESGELGNDNNNCEM